MRAGYHPGLTTHATGRAGPGIRPPLRRGELATYRCGAKFPSTEGCRRSRRGGLLVTRYSYVCRSGALRPVRILVFVQTALSLVFTYSDASRAKRGDPVNKKALRAYRPQTYCPGLPQSYANVSNVSVALRNDRGVTPFH